MTDANNRKILIVEDNENNRESITNVVKTCEGVGEILSANNVIDAHHFAMEKEIGLFLVDIVLDSRKPDDIAGIRFVEKIREIPRYHFTPIIIITQLYDQTMIAFHHFHCYGYIEKPFEEARLKKLVEDALKIPLSNMRENEFYYYRKDGIIYSIECCDILYLEATIRKIHIHMIDDDIYTPYRPIQALLDDLPKSCFVQCHRSVIINMHHVKSIDRTNRIITMKDGNHVDIGRKYLNNLIHNNAFGNM